MVVTSLLHDVATNAGVLVALVLVYAALSWPFEEADPQVRARRINRRRLVCGVLFGLGAVLTMNVPVTVVQLVEQASGATRPVRFELSNLADADERAHSQSVFIAPRGR